MIPLNLSSRKMDPIRCIQRMAAAFIAVFLVSKTIGQDGASFAPVSLFYQYLNLDGQLSEQGLPSEGREALTKERDRIRDQLLENAEASRKAFVEEYSLRKVRGGKAFQGELMTFSRQTGIAKAEFTEFAREVILETDLSEPRDPLLTTALEYLGEHGEKSDLELMARLDGHVNQTYAQIRDHFAARLKDRLLKGGGAEPKNSDSLRHSAGPSEVKGVADLAESEHKESFGLPFWGLFVIVVAVLGTLIHFIRAILRGRAS